MAAKMIRSQCSVLENYHYDDDREGISTDISIRGHGDVIGRINGFILALLSPMVEFLLTDIQRCNGNGSESACVIVPDADDDVISQFTRLINLERENADEYDRIGSTDDDDIDRQRRLFELMQLLCVEHAKFNSDATVFAQRHGAGQPGTAFFTSTYQSAGDIPSFSAMDFIDVDMYGEAAHHSPKVATAALGQLATAAAADDENGAFDDDGFEEPYGGFYDGYKKSKGSSMKKLRKRRRMKKKLAKSGLKGATVRKRRSRTAAIKMDIKVETSLKEEANDFDGDGENNPDIDETTPQDANCSHCDMHFESVVSLRAHMKQVHPLLRRFKCRYCSYSTNNRNKLEKQHVLSVHNKVKQFQCDECGKKFSRKGCVVVHKNLVHFKIKAFTCEVCQASLSGRGALDAHRRTHTGEKPFFCELCGKSFSQRGSLVKHQNLSCPKSAAERNFPTCDLCGKSLISLEKVQRHKKFHCPKRPDLLKLLDSIEPTQLPSNVSNVNGITGNRDPMTLYSCKYCYMCYSSKEQLVRHMTSIHRQGEFKCTDCTFSTNIKQNLSKHIATVHQVGAATFECDICLKKFSRATRLKSHKDEVHFKIKSFTCEVCSATFSKKSHLTRHTFTHTGEKPFICGTCLKGFNQASSLHLHKRRCVSKTNFNNLGIDLSRPNETLASLSPSTFNVAV